MNAGFNFDQPLPQGFTRGLSRSTQAYQPLRQQHTLSFDHNFKDILRWRSQRVSTFYSPVLVKELFLAVAKPLFIHSELQRQALQQQSNKIVPLPKKAKSAAAGGVFAAAAMRLLANISPTFGGGKSPTRTDYGFWNRCSCIEPKKYDL